MRAVSAAAPCSRCSAARNRTTRWAATSNPPVSKIWLPMWLCSPTSDSPSDFSTRRTASAASGSAKPNFWSSCAVAMNSWVCASTPTVRRTITSATAPRSRAIASSRAISWNESSTTRPTPASTAAASSAGDLLLPCNVIRSAGNPARKRDGQLAAAADVEREALLGDPARHLRAEERLGRVVHRRTAPNAAANSWARARKSASSITNSGVPWASARSRTSTPAMLDRPRRAAHGVPRPDGGRQHVELGGGAGARPGRLGRGEDPGVQWPGRMGPHVAASAGRSTSAVTSAPAR